MENKSTLFEWINGMYANMSEEDKQKAEEFFPELKESEDERIINRIKKAVESYWSDEPLNEIVAWLERHKEQKHIPKFKVGDRIYDKRDSYNRSVIREVGKDYYINAFAQKMDMAYTDANFEFLEHLENDRIDSKPAEWSEEDEEMIRCIRKDYLRLSEKKIIVDKEGLSKGRLDWIDNRLKSLRPQPDHCDKCKLKRSIKLGKLGIIQKLDKRSIDNIGIAIDIIKDIKGKHPYCSSDDGIYECDRAIETLENIYQQYNQPQKKQNTF